MSGEVGRSGGDSPHVGLSGGWSLWRWSMLRGAGFRADRLLDLAAPAAAARADEILDRDGEASRAEGALVASLSGAADAPPERVRALRRARRLIRKGRTPPDLDGRAGPLSEAWQRARERAALARDDFLASFGADLERVRRTLRAVAADDRFREAVCWQNRRAVATALDHLLRQPEGGSDHGTRKHEQLVVSYLQRYAGKNDSIGFFGPVGWARLGRDGGFAVRPGTDFLARRRVYFEAWGIDALCEAIEAGGDLGPWLRPRRQPMFGLSGTTLHPPFSPPVELPAEDAELLAACDGHRTARAIVAAHRGVGSSDPGGAGDPDHPTYERLRDLERRGLITWRLDVPLGTWPEESLRDLLAAVEDPSTRARALAPLDALCAARDRVARSAGDAAALLRATEDLERVFTHETGRDATRLHGQTYASRTLVYEDCVRGARVSVGPAVLDRLGPPLALLLDSARWFCHRVAGRYRDAFRRLHDELCAGTGRTEVELLRFWGAAQSSVFRPEDHRAKLPIVGEVLAEFQARWGEILAIPEAATAHHLRSADLAREVSRAFAAPGAGWWSARHHCPDVMIAADGPDAIARGELTLVLGELHMGINTLASSLSVHQHPAPEDLFAAYAADRDGPVVSPVTPKSWSGARTNFALARPDDFRLAFAPEPTAARDRVLAAGDLVVDRDGDSVAVRTRDGALCFDVVDFFGVPLSVAVASFFQPIAPRPHTPRVSIDDLVIARERWRLSPAEIPFAGGMTAADRFVAARRWRRERGMPRFCFVKVPVEVKPTYLDFDSPPLVEAFAKLVRRTARDRGEGDDTVDVMEMLPAHGSLWLPGEGGGRTVSELRLVAVDPLSERRGEAPARPGG